MTYRDDALAAMLRADLLQDELDIVCAERDVLFAKLAELATRGVHPISPIQPVELPELEPKRPAHRMVWATLLAGWLLCVALLIDRC